MYNDKLYKQVDEVAMGSPLGPTIANFFLAHLETVLLKNKLKSYPALYLRYVDDIFAIFEDEQDCSEFLNLLNQQHSKIAFTLEKSINSLPFLDTEMTIREGSLESSVWRKPSHTGLLLNYHAVCPLKWKFGLITCILNRAKAICSTESLFRSEITKLKEMFFKNGYSAWFFNKILNSFYNSRQQENDKTSEDEKDNQKLYLEILEILFGNTVFGNTVWKYCM